VRDDEESETTTQKELPIVGRFLQQQQQQQQPIPKTVNYLHRLVRNHHAGPRKVDLFLVVEQMWIFLTL
jgi:hypothetical protein